MWELEAEQKRRPETHDVARDSAAFERKMPWGYTLPGQRPGSRGPRSAHARHHGGKSATVHTAEARAAIPGVVAHPRAPQVPTRTGAVAVTAMIGTPSNWRRSRPSFW